MALLNHVLDMGFDYGASGGDDDFGATIVETASGREVINLERSRPIGQWQLGQRSVDLATARRLHNFWLSARGPGHQWYYQDWNDCLAIDERLVLTGGATAQLICTYGGFGNDYVRTIERVLGSSCSFKLNGAPLTVAGVNENTGVVTFNLPYPSNGSPADVVTWSGTFYKRARFAVDRFAPQFLAWEERPGGRQAIYSLPSLIVREVLP